MEDAASWRAAAATATAAFPEEADPQDTGVDGEGLWHVWTRTFSTFRAPLAAVWDLLDNAFDASDSHSGRLHIEGGTFSPDGAGSMIILNNCKQPIKPLKDILKAYNSGKNKAATHQDKNNQNSLVRKFDIGENGVGIKQGCACLSDLSFCLTRNGTEYGLGILAKCLQKPNRVYLPSFTFQQPPGEDVETFVQHEIWFLCQANSKVRTVISMYGDGNLDTGVRRLVELYCRMSDPMSYGSWGDSMHVFGLVLHSLKHRSGATMTTLEEQEASLAPRCQKLEATRSFHQFLDEIAEELPKRYLHISGSFDLQVNRNVVNFAYWQRRLVELTKFEIVGDTLHRRVVPLNDTTDNNTTTDSQRQYRIWVYMGFDAIRCSDPEAQSCPSLAIYSRQSGRLIKDYKDARGELRLTSGGTDFCQGLTIIVDDSMGFLPLTPTKQDLAWGERHQDGATHHQNLIAWLSAITKLYYKHHFAACEEKKVILTERVCSQKDRANTFVAMDDAESPEKFKSTIGECDLTTFESLEWYLTKDGEIDIKKRYTPYYDNSGNKVKQFKAQYYVVSGKDTIMQLPTEATAAAALGEGVDDVEGEEMPAMSSMPGVRKRPARKSCSSIISPSPKKRKRKIDDEMETTDDLGSDDGTDLLRLSYRQQSMWQKHKDGERRAKKALERARKAEADGLMRLKESEELLQQSQDEIETLRRVLQEEKEKKKKYKDRLRAKLEATASEDTAHTKAEIQRLREQLASVQQQLNFHRQRSERLAQENTQLLNMNRAGVIPDPAPSSRAVITIDSSSSDSE